MVTLGNHYAGEQTGFSGAAVSRTEYFYGCVRIGLQHGRKDAQVPLPPAKPMPDLRETSGLPSQVSVMPDSFRELALKGEVPGVTKAIW